MEVSTPTSGKQSLRTNRIPASETNRCNRSGDAVRSSDPFKLGEDRQRPWLIVNNDTHPFGDEQHVAVAISTKEYGDSIPLKSDIWKTGGAPRESFVSPWAVHSPRIEDQVAWQGRVAKEFVDHVVETVETYLR